MFFLIYKKYSLLPLQTRLLAGFSALAFIILLLIILIINFFVLDKISFYNSRETVFYLKITNDRKGDFYKNQLISEILNNFSLAELDRHFLNKDLAVTCASPQRQLRCQLLIRTNEAQLLQKYLTEKNIDYQELGHGVVAIGKSDKPLKKTYNPFLYFKFQEGLVKHDLFLVAYPPRNLNSELEKILSLLPRQLRLTGKTSNNGIIINGGINTKTDSGLSNDFDILISNTASQADNEKSLGYPIDKTGTQQLTELFSGQNFKLAMIKKAETGNLVNAYDFFVSSDQIINKEKELILEKILLDLAQPGQTTLKTVYLNDGTKVKLLKPAVLAFSEPVNGLKTLTLENGTNLYYGYQNNQLIIGNNFNFQPQLGDFNSQKLSVRLASLPKDNLIRIFLSNFSYLTVVDNQITIK